MSGFRIINRSRIHVAERLLEPRTARWGSTTCRLVGERDAPDHGYAGHGWARVPRVRLGDGAGEAGIGRTIADALVLALHSPDDAEPLTDDVELELDDLVLFRERRGVTPIERMWAFT